LIRMLMFSNAMGKSFWYRYEIAEALLSAMQFRTARRHHGHCGWC